MRRIIFIDDDKTELDAFLHLVGGEYDCVTIHWPHESAKLFGGPAPDIFVSDLYLPPSSGDTAPTAAQREEAVKATKKVAERFFGLYASASLDDKARLQETMKAIGDAYDMLRLQYSALQHSPDHGVALLTKLKACYPEVPFVFYSRKMTPEDVIRVLRMGAADAIRKGALTDEEVVLRLAAAQELHRRDDVKNIRACGFNVNATVLPREILSSASENHDVDLKSAASWPTSPVGENSVQHIG
jgi:DNA-binding NarL/FixJ family response regulator